MPSNVAWNNVFVEGLSFICMEEDYTLEDVFAGHRSGHRRDVKKSS